MNDCRYEALKQSLIDAKIAVNCESADKFANDPDCDTPDGLVSLSLDNKFVPLYGGLPNFLYAADDVANSVDGLAKASRGVYFVSCLFCEL